MADNDRSQQFDPIGTVPDDDGMPIGAILKLVVAGLVVAAVVVFVLQNLNNVDVSFLSWSFEAPLILLLAIAAVAGVLIRWLISFVRARQKRG